MNIFLKITAVIIALSGLPVPVLAQDSLNQKIFTLSEIIAAIDQNPALLAFDEKIKSYDAYSKAARAWDAPQVSGGFWMTPYRMKENPNSGSLMLAGQQMIPNPGKQKAELNYMKGMSSVEEAMKSSDKQDIIEQAKKAYYEWIILKKKLKVLEQSEALLNLMIKSGEIGYTYNQNLLSRIYKAKSQLYDLQNTEIMIKNEIQQKNIELNTIMNIDKTTVYDIDTIYTLTNYNLLPIDTTELVTNRSDIRTIQESKKLLELRRNFELSKRKPEFGVQYAHMNGFGMMPNQFNLMGMVTIPIVPWATRGYEANLKGISFDMDALNRREEAILNEVAGIIQKTKTDIANKKKQIEMYEKNIIPALEKNYTTSLISFEHMKEDMFMTIDAWMALKMARIEYLNLLGELLKMQAEYERQIEK